MKQKLIFTLIFFIYININAQNTNLIKYKFTYQLTYQPDSTDVDSKKSEEMLLFTNNNISIFQSKNEFLKDSMIIDLEKNSVKEIKTLDISKFPKTKFHYKILKEKSKDSITIYDKIYTDNFLYKESKGNIKWKIKNDTLTINGFKCQKATTFYAGRNYEAWFSNTIPISDGPYKFRGLPGLVIKVLDSKKHYVFELIRRSNINLLYPDLKPKKNLYITNKVIFFKKLNDFKSNIFERVSQSGFTLDEEYKQVVKAKLKKRNNHIELNIK